MNKNIVTQEQVDENMQDVLCRTEMEWNRPVTYVSVRMKNGFVVRASSSCVDPANYDEEYGKQICLKKIEDKVWELLGYALQEEVYQTQKRGEEDIIPSIIDSMIKELHEKTVADVLSEDECACINSPSIRNPLILAIENYFASKNIKHKDAAKELGLNESVFSLIMNGKRKISLALAKKLYSKLNLNADLILKNI